MDELNYLYCLARRGLRKHKTLIIVLLSLLLVSTVFVMRRPGFGHEVGLFWDHHREHVNDVIGLMALALALVACVGLEWMRHAVSTRFIGKFPEHLDKITKLVRGATA